MKLPKLDALKVFQILVFAIALLWVLVLLT